MKVEELGAAALAGALPVLEDLRHDLGKYVCFEVRFAGPDADLPTLRAALKADLLATRRRGDRTEAAWELWGRLRPAILSDDPDVLALEQAVQALQQVDLEGDRPALDAAAATADQVRQATRRLHERARQAALALGLDPDEP